MTDLEGPLSAVTLIPGCSVVFEAIDPVSGNAVTGVKVTNVAIYADSLSLSSSSGSSTPTAPLFVPLPQG